MTSRWFSLIAATVLGLVCIAGTRVEAASPLLQMQGARVDLNAIADQSRGNIEWRHGAFLYLEALGGPQWFYILDRSGNMVGSVKPNIPGAAQFWITGFDRYADGTIVFSGGSFSEDGRDAPFIAWISADGQTSRIMRTTPYHPVALALAPDGTIWTVGMELINHQRHVPGVNPDANILRHYDRNGTLLSSVGPQSKFEGPKETHRLYNGYVVASADRVGWYAPRDGRGNYVELSTDTMTPHGYPGLDVPFKAVLSAFVLTSNDNAVACVEDPTPHTKTTYVLDRVARKWLPVQVPEVEGVLKPRLIGGDDEQLVLGGGTMARTFAAGFFSLVP